MLRYNKTWIDGSTEQYTIIRSKKERFPMNYSMRAVKYALVSALLTFTLIVLHQAKQLL